MENENEDTTESIKKMIEVAKTMAKFVGDKHQLFITNLQSFLLKCNENGLKCDTTGKDFSACENILKQLEQAYEDIINEE